MDETKHKLWLEKYLPMMVRLSRIAETDSNHASLKKPIEALEKEYTKTKTTVLSVFRDVMKAHVEGNKHDKIWYLSHCINMSLIPNRDSPSYWLIDTCPDFFSYTDEINQILDDLKIAKVEPYEPVPPPKTRDDLKTEHGRQLYDLMDDWIKQICAKDPNSAFGLAMTLQYLLSNEDDFFDENNEFKPDYKFHWKASVYIEADKETKNKYFDKEPMTSSDEEDDEEDVKEITKI